MDYLGWFIGAYIGWPGKYMMPECWSTHYFTAKWCVVPCSLTGNKFLCSGTFGHSGRPSLMMPYSKMVTVEERRFHYRQSRGWLLRMPLADWRGIGSVSYSVWIVSNVPNVVDSSSFKCGFAQRAKCLVTCDNEWIHQEPTITMQVQVQLSFAMPSKTLLTL